MPEKWIKYQRFIDPLLEYCKAKTLFMPSIDCQIQIQTIFKASGSFGNNVNKSTCKYYPKL